ncbi:MAG: tetratricopeptide repeat protein [Anaerolineales bacterium]|nr:tetratricopeptide repeat protein [Anaerolineales bacterium]
MSSNEDLFQRALNEGHSAAWDQSWEDAIRYYRQALQFKPEHPGALANLGLASFEAGAHQEAVACYKKLIQLTPNDPAPFERLSRIDEQLGAIDQAVKNGFQAAEGYLRIKDVNKAIENWVRVAQLKPDNLPAHSRLAMVFEHLKLTAQAVREWLIIASLYQHAGEVENASKAISRALSLHPESKEAQRAAAMVREGGRLPMPAALRPSQPAPAAPEAPRAEMRAGEADEHGLDPVEEAHQRALSLLAGVLFESNEEDQQPQISRRGLQVIMTGARNVFKQVDSSRVVYHLSRLVDLESRGENNQAAEELERAMEAGLDHPAAFFELGYLRAFGERLESANRSLQHAAHNPEFALGARLLLAKNLVKLGREGEAAVEFMGALQAADCQSVEPAHADDLQKLYEPLVETLRQGADAEVQGSVCQSVLSLLDRRDWRQRVAQARQQLPMQEKGAPPTPIAEVLMEATSGQVMDSLHHIYHLARAGHQRSAMEEAFYVLQFMPAYLPLHLYMGELLLKLEQIDEAVEKFLVVARSYHTRGESARATDLYRRVIALTPMATEPRRILIDQLMELGQVDEALGEYLQLADVYYNLADLDNARATLDAALELAGHAGEARAWKVRILYQIADIDMQSLDWRSALSIYEGIRELEPDDARARQQIAELNLRLGQDKPCDAELGNYLAYLRKTGGLAKAAPFFENLVQEHPNKPFLRLRLAEVYSQIQRVPEAINHLDAAGDMLMEAGDHQGAILALKAILGLNPPNAGEYQKLLDSLR